MTEGRILVIVPGRSGRAAGVDARLLAAAGLADGFAHWCGGVDLLTSDGLEEVASPSQHGEAAPSGGRGRDAVRSAGAPSVAGRAVSRLPRSVAAALGDARALTDARRLRSVAASIPKRGYAVVVQFHRRWNDAGEQVARRDGAPFVVRVEALEVREEADWGIHRPGWGRPLERVAERRILDRADLLVSVSSVLDRQLEAMGIPPERRVVVPNGVDLDRFSPGPPDHGIRAGIGSPDSFVIGWVGGFRPFHGLEMVPDLARRLLHAVPSAILCLVGAGPMRAQVARSVEPFANVRLVPAVDPTDVPRWIRSFDAGLVLADARQGFHYSPMKLLEYLACARPAIAARAGDVGSMVRDEEQALLVEPGDVDGYVEAIARLADDRALGRRLGVAGRELVVAGGGWDQRARAILDALAGGGHRAVAKTIDGVVDAHG